MIAVPIIAEDIESALRQIEQANRKADAIELRLDSLKKVSENDLKIMIKSCKKTIIATARSRREGGHFQGTEKQRAELLISAASLGADFIDIEESTKKEVIDLIIEKTKPARIILSYHNLKETPSFDELKIIFDRMANFNYVSVIKIVCYAQKLEDNKKCFALIKYAKEKGKRIICFCMGPSGKDSRILSLSLGAYLTFASLEKGLESAEGQIPIDDLKRLYHGLSILL